MDAKRGRSPFVVLLVLAGMALTAIPAQASNKVLQGEFGNEAGGAAGHVSFGAGVAVNRTGVGGVSPGEVYVPSFGSNRVDEFDESGNFVRAWGYDVTAAGPDNTGANEQEQLAVKATGGKYSLTLTTAAGSGKVESGSNVITNVTANLGAFHVGDAITTAPSGLPAATTITAIGSGTLTLSKNATSNITATTLSASQNTGAGGNGSWGSGSTTVTVNSISSGAFAEGQVLTTSTGTGIQVGTEIINVSGNTLTLDKPTTAASSNKGIFGHNIAPSASASELEAILAALPGVGAGVIAVTGGPGNATGSTPYTLTFSGGSFSGNDVTMSPKAEGLTGGSPSSEVSLTTTVSGGGIEICKASISTDVCKTGNASVLAGGLSAPEGIAINQANGNIYVSDSGNRRIDIFTAQGAFEGAFGWKVNATAPAGELQLCTTVTGCQAGEASAAAGGFSTLGGGANAAGGLAVNPSNGHLYVSDQGNHRINEFSFTLNGSNEVTATSFTRALGWKVKVTGAAEELQECTTVTGCQAGTTGAGNGQFPASTPTGLAVDSGGFIYAVSAEGTCSAANPCRIQKFNPNGTFKESFGPGSGGIAECQLNWTTGTAGAEAAGGIAVDPANQHVFVAEKVAAGSFKVCEFDSNGALKDVSPPAALAATGSPALALNANEHVYVNAKTNQTVGTTYILGPAPPAPGARIVAANEITATTATLNGKVDVPAPGGPGFKTTYRFEYSGDNGLNWIKIPAPDVSVGQVAGTFNVSQKISELQPNLTYRFRLVATTAVSVTSAEEIFTTPAAKPTVAKTIALPVSGNCATLTGEINPNNSPTSYRFEWGTSSGYGNQAPSFEPFVGEGGQPITVKASICGLSLSSSYHFRLVATNGLGATFGPDASFTTNSWEGLNAAGLPDQRGIELVSPAEKRPEGEVEEEFASPGVTYQAAADGQSFYFPILLGLADTTAGGQVNYRAMRSAAGWQSTQMSPPSLAPSPKPKLGRASQYVYVSANLSCGLIETPSPLTADTPNADRELGVYNLYRRDANGVYTLISNTVPLNPLTEEGFYTIAGTSADCSRVFFRAGVSPSGYQLLPGVSGLYEWDDGVLRDAGTLPNGAAGGGAKIGGNSGVFASPEGSAFNAVAPSGRFFFSATSNEGGDSGKQAVFVRKSPVVTVDASQKQAGGTRENNGANYETASPDGSHVLFTSNYGLTGTVAAGLPGGCNYGSGVTINGEGCDLYDYDVETGQLKDLSADTNPADNTGASVAGVVAVSNDGSYVYFAAKGQLVPGKGNTQAQNMAGAGAANLYLAQGGNLSYVATVAKTDLTREKGAAVPRGSMGGPDAKPTDVDGTGERGRAEASVHEPGEGDGLPSGDGRAGISLFRRPGSSHMRFVSRGWAGLGGYRSGRALALCLEPTATGLLRAALDECRWRPGLLHDGRRSGSGGDGGQAQPL